MIYKCECGQVHDNGIDRRHFLGLGTSAVFGYALVKFMHPVETLASDVRDTITPKFLNLIYVNLNGGPSHSDLFDVKTSEWSSVRIRPDNWEDRMQVQKLGDLPWPVGLMGELGQHSRNILSIPVRYWSEAHEIGQYLSYTGYDRNPAFQPERPHIGAAIAAEMVRQSRRRDTDILPGFVSIGGLTYQNGFLSGMFAPFVSGATRTGVANTHPDGRNRYDQRFDLLMNLDGENRSANPPLGKPAADMRDFYTATKKMMYNPIVDRAFKVNQEDQARYSPIGDANGSDIGNGAIVARNILKEKSGTRFINIGKGGWDNHGNIYQALFGTDPARPNGNARQVSKALAELVNDLKSTPGELGGSLFDETVIMITGDFGRTPAANYRTGTGINGGNGRDHYRNGAVLLIGGAINGGRQIGQSDETGKDIVDSGWDPFARTTRRPRTAGGYPNAGMETRFEDVLYTVYKGVGIDPATQYTGTPSGRPYQLVYAANEIFSEIPGVFA